MLVPEWLTGMTRNHVGFARAGSNPAKHAFFCFSLCRQLLFLSLIRSLLLCSEIGKSWKILVHGGQPNMCNDFIGFLLCG